jgi:hypothetical protein
MRKLLVIFTASSALLLPALPAAQSAGPPTAQAACTRATIVGQRKCIARGQFCTHTTRANRDYHRYGYHCGRRDYTGRYHLVYY